MADPRERYVDEEEALTALVEGMLSGLWVGGPGIIQSFDPVKLTSVVQPAIQGRRMDQTGKIIFANMPLCLDVPTYFFSGGGFTITAPIKKGDECFIAFADRCIDSWWQQGGIQPPLEYRIHDLSDGFAFVGFRSLPRGLSNVSTTSLQVRSDDGTTYLEIAPSGVINLKAPGGFNVTAPTMTVNGNVVITDTLNVENTGSAGETSTITGNLKVVSGDIVADTISLKNHVHTGVQTGSGSTGLPVG